MLERHRRGGLFHSVRSSVRLTPIDESKRS